MVLDSLLPVSPKMINPNAVGLGVDDREDFLTKFDKLSRVQLALKDGVLDPLAVVKTDLCDAPQAALSGLGHGRDVVGEQKIQSERSGLFDEEGRIGVVIAPEMSSEEAGLDLREQSIGDFLFDERVDKSFLLSFLPGGQDFFS